MVILWGFFGLYHMVFVICLINLLTQKQPPNVFINTRYLSRYMKLKDDILIFLNFFNSFFLDQIVFAMLWLFWFLKDSCVFLTVFISILSFFLKWRNRRDFTIPRYYTWNCCLTIQINLKTYLWLLMSWIPPWYPILSDGANLHSFLIKFRALPLILILSKSIESIPLRIRKYVLTGSEAVNGGLKQKKNS